MMETHDGLGMGYGGPLTTEQKYNELLFASMGADEWEPDLIDMVQAIFVQSGGTAESLENGRLLRRSVLLWCCDRLLRSHVLATTNKRG